MESSTHRVGQNYGVTVISGAAPVHQGNIQIFSQSLFSKEESCHQTFKTSDYESHKLSIHERARGTCRWVLDHPQFRQWQQSCCNDFLWISADPGCGKSVLAKSLIDYDLRNQDQCTICYFFFKRGSKEQENLATALCAILHQLFSSQKHLLCHAVPEWQKTGERIQQEIPVMWRILRTAAVDPAARPILCIIDALDECCHEDQQYLIKLIGKFYAQSSANESKNTLSFRSQVGHENDRLREEIKSVIRQEVDKLTAKYALTTNHRELLQSRLMRMEQRTYLWWYLAYDEIRRTYETSSCPNQVYIDTLPTSVDHAYERILERITTTQRPYAKQILLLMTVARRSLTIGEMALALETITAYQTSGSSTMWVDDEHLRKQIRQWCGLFVFINHSKPYFIHSTARDFLLRSSDRLGSGQHETAEWRHSLSLALAHKSMAIICHRLMQEHDTDAGPTFMLCDSAALVRRSESRETLRSYAVGFGVYHTAEAIRCIGTYRSVFFIHRLSSFGMDLQAIDNDGKSLLHRMTDLYSLDISNHVIETILKCGGLVQTADGDNMNCLHYAVLRNNCARINLFLKAGFSINRAVKRAGNKYHRSGEGFIDGNAGHERGSDTGLTALHAAALFGRLKALSLLIQQGANVHAVDQYRWIALHVAVRLSIPHKQIYDAWEEGEQMVDHIWDFDDEDVQCQVMEEARMIRMGIIQKLCEISPGLVHIQDNKGRTALHLVSYDNINYAARTVSILLAFGANPRERDKDGIIPIHRAARQRSVECMKLLVPRGRAKDFGIVDNHGRNALHFAAMSSDKQVVSYILEQPESANLYAVIDFNGQDALQISLFDEKSRFHGSHLGIVQTLLAAGARADRLNHQGRDALAHYLVKSGLFVNAEIVRTLLEHGSNPLFQDAGGKNLAHHLVSAGDQANFEALVILQMWGVHIRDVDFECRTVLHNAAIAGSVTQDLLHHLGTCLGLDFLARDKHGKTALEHVNQMLQQKQPAHLYRPDRWRDSMACFQKAAVLGGYCLCDTDAKSKSWIPGTCMTTAVCIGMLLDITMKDAMQQPKYEN